MLLYRSNFHTIVYQALGLYEEISQKTVKELLLESGRSQ